MSGRWIRADHVKPGNVVAFPYGGMQRYVVCTPPVRGRSEPNDIYPDGADAVRFQVRIAGLCVPDRKTALWGPSSPLWLVAETWRPGPTILAEGETPPCR